MPHSDLFASDATKHIPVADLDLEGDGRMLGPGVLVLGVGSLKRLGFRAYAASPTLNLTCNGSLLRRQCRSGSGALLLNLYEALLLVGVEFGGTERRCAEMAVHVTRCLVSITGDDGGEQ